MNKAKAYRELQKRQLRRSDACAALTFLAPDYYDGIVAAKIGVAPDMLKRQRQQQQHNHLGVAIAGAPRASTASFPGRASSDGHRGGRVVVANEELRSKAIDGSPPKGPLSSVSSHQWGMKYEDARPFTSAGITTSTISLASPSPGQQSAANKIDLVALQVHKNGHRLSAASVSGSSGRSNDHGKAARSSGAASMDGNNVEINKTVRIWGDQASTDDEGKEANAVQFPTASKMRQILSEIESHQHQSHAYGDDKPAGIMKKPPTGPQQWKNGGTVGTSVQANGLHAATITAVKSPSSKGAGSRLGEKELSTTLAHLGVARRQAMGKQVSFVDAPIGERDVHIAASTPGSTLSNGGFTAGGYDQPLMLTSRNLEMHTSLLTNAALSQPSAAHEDRVLQWVKEHQPSANSLRDVSVTDESCSLLSLDIAERDASRDVRPSVTATTLGAKLDIT